MLQTAIVILNWNGRKYLHDFLPFVIKFKPDSAKIYVADNASSDDSIELMNTHFPNVELIKLKENHGFAKGYNEALKQIEAKYYVLLNSDIEVTENWIESLIDYLENNPEVAACQPKIKSWHNREKFEYAGAGGGYIDYLGYPFCRGRIFNETEKDIGQYDDIQEVFWASGACLFVKADVFHKIGGFDNDFFAHMEEIDFCWRAKNQGYSIVYNPESTVYHIGGGTLPKNNSHKTYLNFKNNFCLLYKNLPQNRLFSTFFYRMLLDGIAAFKFLIDGSFKDSRAVFEAHLYFYKNISKLAKKRKALSQNQVSGIYKKNIVFEHFIRNKKLFSELNMSKFSK
ncbi:MAG: glycosyltransferase family 2 protein [Bacteroidales bacterium]|nr:glycosyltransferase family 2 protein [Bacteroidales bacterium]